MTSRLAPIVVAAVVLAGCAGGDERPGRTATTTTTTSTTASTTPATTTAPPGPRFPRPTDAAAAAAAITAGRRAAADPSSPAVEVDRAVVAEQLALRALADHPEWDVTVAAALAPEHRQGAADDVAANRELRALVSRPRDTLPPWRIVEAKPADELRRYYEEASADTGVPWEYLAAVNLVETRMGRLRGISTAGAQGPMQFLPSTWAAYGGGGDIESDRDAIRGAANYLRANGGADGRMANALWHYNHSDRYVRAVTLYAERMRRDPTAYPSYHRWQVVYWTTLGDVVLPVGYEAETTRPVTPQTIAEVESIGAS